MSEIADRDELLRILTDAARDGSVSAAKTLLEELRRDDTEEPSDFDALDNVRPIRAS
jgi:hypothetical protein